MTTYIKTIFIFQKSQSQDGGGTSAVSDKRVTLRAVKNFMKIGRSRNTSKERGERDSSTEDERRWVLIKKFQIFT